jgi:hypothetical protein
VGELCAGFLHDAEMAIKRRRQRSSAAFCLASQCENCITFDALFNPLKY